MLSIGAWFPGGVCCTGSVCMDFSVGSGLCKYCSQGSSNSTGQSCAVLIRQRSPALCGSEWGLFSPGPVVHGLAAVDINNGCRLRVPSGDGHRVGRLCD